MKASDTRLNLLIVDDVPKNIQLAASIFKEDGYQMAYAQNGETALELAQSSQFDLILLDIMMPGMDGFEVCKVLKSSPAYRDVPIIFITARNDTDSIVKGFGLGAADYVTKPFSRAELRARIRTHLQLYQSRKTLRQMNLELKTEIEYRKQVEAELRESERKYRYQAVHDNLTGLYNTRFLYKSLNLLISMSEEKSGEFSLIFLDIDNFKRVVDTYGHLNGSQAICEVAATIQSCLEKPAYGVAYGGDEFVVVLPGMGKQQARLKAEQIRTRMNETVYLKNRGHKVHLSASFGISTYPEDSADMTGLLTFADRAMFDVKASGKNGVATHD